MSKNTKTLPEQIALRVRQFPLVDADILDFFVRLRPEETLVFLDSNSGPRELASHSYLAWSPFAQLISKQGQSALQMQSGELILLSDNPFDALAELLGSFRVQRFENQFPFSGGVLGWLSYELGAWLETLPPSPPELMEFPQLWMGVYDTWIGKDHKTGEQYAFVLEFLGNPLRSGDEYCAKKLQSMRSVLERAPISGKCDKASQVQSDHTRASYLEAVRKAKEYIFSGDIYEVNLSQRFDLQIDAAGIALYQNLRKTNPAPYSAFLSTPYGEILSSSPELFLRVRNREVETRPIKGTMARDPDPEKNAQAKQALLRSEKDRAELTMIIDLERNDLKRVCETGSVKVPRLYGVEEYETVNHLVSTIQGRLKPDCRLIDVLRATFPGGSITGAPKIRSMEIIAELESSGRSVYTGSIGWLNFDGDAELNIAIRTMLKKQNAVSFRVGGGIIADSDPEKEYEETLHKGRGLARALGVPW